MRPRPSSVKTPTPRNTVDKPVASSTAQVTLLAVAGTAALLALAAPPASVAALGTVALVPWLWAVVRSGVLHAVLASLAAGTLFGLLTAWWIPAALENLGSHPAQAWLAWLLVAIWGKGVPFVLVGWAVWAARRARPWLRIAVVSGAFLAVDALLSTWRWGLPWSLLGHSQLGALGVAQLAAAGGVPLVSALLAGVNQAVAIAWEGRHSQRAGWRPAAALGGAWAALALLGLPLAEALRPSDARDDPVRLLLVQPNLPRGERWAASQQALHLERIGAYTARALRDEGVVPSAIVWPENLLTTPLDVDPALSRALQEHVDRLGLPVVLGAAESAHGSTPRTYRSAVLWVEPGRGAVARLHKERAVPVVEAMASSPIEAAIARAFGGAGRGPKVEEAPAPQSPFQAGFELTPVLCFEALFPGVVARRRNPASLALLHLADDSWVGGTVATRQLLAFAHFRAIEQRLTLLRLAHGGLSAVVDPFGRVTRELPLDAYAHALAELQPSARAAFRERGALLALPGAVALGVWWITSRWPRRRTAREQRSVT